MNRKTALIVKLCALLLCLFMLLAFSFGFMLNGRFGFNMFLRPGNPFPNAKLEQGKSEVFTGVERIVVDTTSYSVEVVEHNESYVEVCENTYKGGIGFGSSNQLYQEGSSLYYSQGKSLGIFNIGIGEIVIKVPKNSILEYDIDVVSGNIEVNASCKEADVKTISGSIVIEGSGEQVQAKSTSGSITIYAGFEEIEAKSTSGSLKIAAVATTKEINAKSTSGSIKIQIPSEAGYRFNYSSTSGTAKDYYDNASLGKKGRYTQGDGAIEINAKTVSGSIRLQDWA